MLVFFSYVGTYILLYIEPRRPNPNATRLVVCLHRSYVGTKSIEGVQGRYFTTVMPLLFVGLAGLPLLQRIRIPSALLVILSVVSLLFYSTGMYLSYHVVCGSQFYQAGLCYQPNYKNWAPDERYSNPISTQLTLKQEIILECNGASEVRVCG